MKKNMNIFGTNVLKNRDINRVIVLGSGMSILDLTKEEKEHINRCKYVIAFNKFMAFYKKAGVLPTHIYFHDNHDASINFFKYILEVCKKDKLKNITFFVNNEYAAACTLYNSFLIKLYIYKLKVLRKIFKINLGQIKNNYIELYNERKIMYFPKGSSLYSFNISDWLKGGDWAKSMQETIFHYRGSLTSVLNIVTILFPDTDVFLVGTDFNNSQYFFEEEINKLKFSWKDWTYDLVIKNGKHFSFQDYQGTTMNDCLLFIIESMGKTNNSLFCVNPNSLLTQSGIKYKSLLQ